MYALKDAYYEVREAESQAFFGLYRAEAEAADLDDLLRRSVRVMARTFRAGQGRLLLLEGPPRGKLARPLYIETGTGDERLIADESYWSYPLRPAAMVQLGFRSKCRWLPRELTLLQALAGRCEEAIENARLEREIRRLEAEARQGEEEERRRIGRELHDEAGQSLLLLRLQLEMIGRDAPEALRGRLGEAREITERTVAELRRIIAALSPAVLERLGLESAVRQLAGRFRKMHPASVRLRLDNRPEELPRQEQEVIYRVAQESLQNIAKHTRATFVNLSLHRTDKSIRLRVSDNGAGFCAETAKGKPMSFGLAGMRERAALLNGTLEIRSAPGKGTVVILNLPKNSAPVATNGKDTRPLN
jgi:signal transduction histidine kinase